MRRSTPISRKTFSIRVQIVGCEWLTNLKNVWFQPSVWLLVLFINRDIINIPNREKRRWNSIFFPWMFFHRPVGTQSRSFIPKSHFWAFQIEHPAVLTWKKLLSMQKTSLDPTLRLESKIQPLRDYGFQWFSCWIDEKKHCVHRYTAEA